MCISRKFAYSTVYLKVLKYKQKFGGLKRQHRISGSEKNIYPVIVCDLPYVFKINLWKIQYIIQ